MHHVCQKLVSITSENDYNIHREVEENHDAAAAVAVEPEEGPEAFAGCLGLLRPHLTATRSPSISRPFAQARAAVSATARSLKLTKAHLTEHSKYWIAYQLDSPSTYLVFST